MIQERIRVRDCVLRYLADVITNMCDEVSGRAVELAAGASRWARLGRELLRFSRRVMVWLNVRVA